MSRIIKVVYHDGTTKKMKIAPLEQSEDTQTQIRNNRVFKKQFDKFEQDILNELNEDIVRQYALDNFDLIDESEIKEKNITDFSDKEIIDEAGKRNLFGQTNNIITEQFLSRFSNIIAVAKPLDIDCLLDELENKYKI